MEVANYKGYKIEFVEFAGQFQVKEISGRFDKFKDATAKIDRVIKAEVKENFPIDVVSSSMKVGKITSYNKVEKEAWFSPESGSRGRERIIDYSGNSRFYKPNENNLAFAKRYKELSDAIGKLSNEQRTLEKKLTEPIIFDTSEE